MYQAKALTDQKRQGGKTIIQTTKRAKLHRERLIGIHEGEVNGHLFIALGSIHGNEPAGVLALQRIFKMLEVEPQRNPAFSFKGTFVGLVGNMQAAQKKQRYLKEDLNRILTPRRVNRVLNTPTHQLENEDLEIHQLISSVRFLIQKFSPKKITVLDLHTTTANGGYFTVSANDQESERIALGLYSPVVRGILSGIGGTTSHYFSTENLGLPTSCLAFESGQHNDPISVEYAISAIVNCFRSLGCVSPLDVDAKHDNLLMHNADKLPKLVEVIHAHHITEADEFVMRPGYKNFQPVQKGEWLATDSNGKIYSPHEALILMPLYQKQGSDGYFLVKHVE